MDLLARVNWSRSMFGWPETILYLYGQFNPKKILMFSNDFVLIKVFKKSLDYYFPQCRELFGRRRVIEAGFFLPRGSVF